MNTHSDAEDRAKTDLAVANRILVNHGVLDAFGHVSVRQPGDPDHFYLSRNLAPGMVTPADIQRYDLDGETEDRESSYLERFIHAEIYRSRPDVTSVVHSHSAGLLPFGLAGVPLRPVWHMAGFLGERTPVFEIRDAAGTGSDLLIGDAGLGRSLAAVLGEGPMALMRGHGSVAVGGSLPQAVYRAVFAELNARVQASAAQLGEIEFLTAEEARSAAATNDGQIRRAWEVWASAVSL